MRKRIEDIIHGLFSAAIFAALVVFAVAFVWLMRLK